MRFPTTRVATLVVFGAAAVAIAAAQAPAPSPAVPFTVHEWGTFTSIAGEDGRAVQWLPQGGQSDLPCFVERGQFKGNLTGTVRMETPVLYFYTPRQVTVNVKVGFRQGSITEWYPHALTTTSWAGAAFDSSISWSDVIVSPALSPVFPIEPGPSHYYKARHTDATPVLMESQR